MDTLKRMKKIIRESAVDEKKKKKPTPKLKFNAGLVPTGVRTTGSFSRLFKE